jgi:hypothetical protein
LIWGSAAALPLHLHGDELTPIKSETRLHTFQDTGCCRSAAAQARRGRHRCASRCLRLRRRGTDSGTPAVDVDGEPRPRIQPRRTVPRPLKLSMGCGGSRWRRRNASSSAGGGVGRRRGSWRPPASPCRQLLQAPVRRRRWPFPRRGREREGEELGGTGVRRARLSQCRPPGAVQIFLCLAHETDIARSTRPPS